VAGGLRIRVQLVFNLQQMSLAVGTLIGAYEITGLIGAGGMGEVYRARDLRLQRMVAIKILPPALALDEERLKRFRREALMLAAFNHPNIAHVHGLEDVSVEGQALTALVMELVEGESLAERLGAGSLRWEAARAIVLQLVDALDASHTAGIIHRDLKPANICLAADGTVKLIDFGLAKTAETPSASTATMDDGKVLGTIHYMSPEQARAGMVDKRTDIWAFGCVLFEMLVGHAPFTGATWADTIVAICEKEPDWSRLPAATTPAIRGLIKRCLAKDLRSRLRDIGDARASFEDDETAAVTGVAAARWTRVVPWAVAAGLTALLIGTMIGGRAAEDSAPQFGRVIRLTSGAAVELGPAISPDGQWVAYLSDAGGSVDLWVKYVAGGDAVNLTRDSGLQLPTRTDLGGLAISPDGSQIAFDAGAKPGTPANLFDSWTIPAPLGGIPRKLVERGRGLRWSPDGSQIAYVRAGAAAGDSIFVADADGSNEREIVPTQGGIHTHWIQWAHDGAALYYIHSTATANTEPAQTYRARLTGGPVEPVILTVRRAAFPIALPDGNGLIYASNPDTSDLGLWWRSADGETTRRITTAVGEYAEPYISRNGQRLVATLFDWDRSLVKLTLDSPGIAEVTAVRSGDLDPAVPPDGGRVVFSSTRGGGRTLWSMTPGAQPRPLTSGPSFDERPSFSPDGRRIAFVSDRDGRRGIWVMNADGGAPRIVTHADVLDAVSWSPDGRRLVFAASDGSAPALFIADLEKGSATRLATAGPATSPAWSPKDVIAYVEARPAAVDAPSSSRIAAITSQGQPVDVGGAAGPNVLNGFLTWSADGARIIAVVEPGAGRAAVWVGDADRAAPFRKVYEAPADVRFRGVAAVPGERAILLGQNRRSTDVVLFDRVR
jgi:Tol biopolymer transport system component